MKLPFNSEENTAVRDRSTVPFVPGRYASFTPVSQGQPVLEKKSKARMIFRIMVLVGALYAVYTFYGILSHGFNFHAAQAAAVFTPTKPQTICLDPGHGGDDPGATTSDGTITERDINLQVAQQVEQSLQTAGYKVYMTRTTNDETLSNHDRYTYCNNQHATIMVSIHHNDYSDSTVDYSTALFYKDQDQALASSILDSVSSKLQTTNDNIAQFEDGVLSESTMPAALSEGFFITSDNEYAQLTAANSTRLSDEAAGITTGIMNYFTKPKASQPAINANPQVIERDDTQ
jgi:N-acetylmuramoyl-L-alanine amidase